MKLTKREYFALKALEAIIKKRPFESLSNSEAEEKTLKACKGAVLYADNLIKLLKESK